MTIPLMFLSIALIVLWFIIGAKGHWALKAAVIAFTLHLCVSVGASLPDFAGWPSSSPVPSKFLVHWLVVKEPDKKTKEPGAIYLWATNLSSEEQENEEAWRRFLIPLDFTDLSQPRVYKVPYSTESHEKADDVIGRIRDGKTVIGESASGEGDGDGSGGEGKGGEGDGDGSGQEGGGGNEGGGQGTFSLSDDVNFQDLPAALLPDKN
jgi:uncharacterized membrane protein YgcG